MNPTRRQFIKQVTATVAAAVVAPSVLAGSGKVPGIDCSAPVKWVKWQYGNQYLWTKNGLIDLGPIKNENPNPKTH